MSRASPRRAPRKKTNPGQPSRKSGPDSKPASFLSRTTCELPTMDINWDRFYGAAADLPGAETIPQQRAFVGPNPSVYVFPRLTTYPNIYRIRVP